MFDKSTIIAIACDHGGFVMKSYILETLRKENFLFEDFGCFSEESVDYPDFSHAIASKIEDKTFKIGILICGSGNGVSIVANKHKDVRCALCWNEEIAKLARLHNDANIISLPGRFIDFDLAVSMVKLFLYTEFEAGRHQNRINKINI